MKISMRHLAAASGMVRLSSAKYVSALSQWRLAMNPAIYGTQAEAIEAAKSYELTSTESEIDLLHAASENLVEQVTAHAEAVERRGDEIDGLLAQIRANMSATHAA